MAKSLKDIVKGVKSSKTDTGKLGKDPGVDYEPKAGDEQKFVKKHSVEKHADRVGNDEHVYKGGTKEAPYKKQKDGVYEEIEQVDEVSKKTAMSAYQSASFVDSEHPKQDAIRGHIERKWGKEMGKHADAHAHVSNYGRNEPGKRAGDSFRHQDKLTGYGSKTKAGRISKSGTMNKQDQKYNASAIKNRLGKHTKPNLPEGIELDEVLTKSTTAGETIHDFVHSKDKKFSGDSKKQRIKRALGAYYAKQNEEVGESDENFNEGYAIQPLLGSSDIAKHKTNDTGEEVDMVRTELKAIANKTMHMLASMPKDVHIEPWVQAKIAQAKEMIGSVHDYVVYGDHDKPEEDEQTDLPMSTPTMFPNMASDNAAGINV